MIITIIFLTLVAIFVDYFFTKGGVIGAILVSFIGALIALLIQILVNESSVSTIEIPTIITLNLGALAILGFRNYLFSLNTSTKNLKKTGPEIKIRNLYASPTPIMKVFALFKNILVFR